MAGALSLFFIYVLSEAGLVRVWVFKVSVLGDLFSGHRRSARV